jgi:hypothetical protein
MKNRMLIGCLLLAISGIVLNGCVKEGPPGKDGYNGYDGYDGEDGNANVIYSDWYTPEVWSFDDESKDWYFQVISPSINEDIVESGVIMAYMSVPGDVYDGAVRPLPAYAIGANWDFLIPGYGKIEFTTDALNMPGSDNYFFRFILIPSSNPALKSALKSQSIQTLKEMPYKEICKKFGIPE